MHNILYVSNLKLKDSSGELTHITGVINSFVKKGHSVTFLTFSTNTKILKLRNLSKKVKLIKTYTFYNNLISSLILFIRFYLINKKHYDVIYIRESYLTLLLIPFILYSKKQIILEYNGIRNFEEKRLIKSVLLKITKILTKVLYKNVTKGIAVSDGIKKYLEDTYHLNNIYTVNNATDLVYSSEYLKFKRNNTIVFIGNLSKWQNFTYLSQLINMYKEKLNTLDIKFEIYGDGVEKEKILNLIKEYNISELLILKGKIPKEKILTVLSKAKIGLLIDTRYYKGTFLFSPLKYFEYQVARIPTLLIVENLEDASSVVEENLFISNKNNFMETIEMLLKYNNKNYLVRTWEETTDEILDIMSK